MRYHGIGRRKSAVAQVYIKSQGLASLQINKKKVFDYFQNDQNSIQRIQQILKTLDQPLAIIVKVKGGGLTGQQEAICLALSKAFYSSGNFLGSKKGISLLKKQITQDARVKERKKYGLKKARKAPQYSKR